MKILLLFTTTKFEIKSYSLNRQAMRVQNEATKMKINIKNDFKPPKWLDSKPSKENIADITAETK